MRWVALVLVLAACGGSASKTAKGSGGAVGAAGDGSGGLGGTSAAASGSGGAASGTASGSGGAAGTTPSTAGNPGAGASGADAGEAGAGGQPATGCVGLDCLAGAELVYWPDREWQRASSATGAGGELLEADYAAKLGAAWDVKVSGDARLIDLTPRAGGDAVHGTRDLDHLDRAWFDLVLFAGGRFVVQGNLPEFQAEHTVYGSGAPILSSTRGVLQAP